MEHRVTKEELRQFLINYHNLNDQQNLKGTEGVKAVFDQLRSIQYDPLNVVGRNPDLVLQSRVKNYQPQMLQKLLYQDYALVDGFDKEMCIYNGEDYSRFAQIRGAHKKWVTSTLSYRGQMEVLDILDEVREHIRINGKTGTKDLSIGESRDNGWGPRKLSSAALDYLYSIGELCVAEKRGTQKYYDFTGKILPVEYTVEEIFEKKEEFYDWYVKRRINCVGALWNRMGGAWQGHYLRKQELREEALNRLSEREEIIPCYVEGIVTPFYIAKENLGFFDYQEKSRKVKFLAPLDNLMWDRDMVQTLFDFEYRWEVYTPAVKRKYGYYVLPVLYGNRLMARFEPEKAGPEQGFAVKNWWWEPDVKVTKKMLQAVEAAMDRFAGYLSLSCFPDNMDRVKGKDV